MLTSIGVSVGDVDRGARKIDPCCSRLIASLLSFVSQSRTPAESVSQADNSNCPYRPIVRVRGKKERGRSKKRPDNHDFCTELSAPRLPSFGSWGIRNVALNPRLPHSGGHQSHALVVLACNSGRKTQKAGNAAMMSESVTSHTPPIPAADDHYLSHHIHVSPVTGEIAQHADYRQKCRGPRGPPMVMTMQQLRVFPVRRRFTRNRREKPSYKRRQPQLRDGPANRPLLRLPGLRRGQLMFSDCFP